MSLQHLYSGFELIRVPQDRGVTLPEGTRETMWVNPGVSIDLGGTEVVQGSPRIGCMYMTEQNPSGGRFQRGFGWIHCMVQKFPQGFSMSLSDFNIPCDGLAATIWVRTGDLMPGLYGFNTGFAVDLYRKTSLWQYNQFGQAEVPVMHKPTYLYIRHSEWKPNLGRMRGVDPDFPFEEFDITPEELMNQ